MAAKRGRKPQHYVASWGETIIGLGRRKDGRWYSINPRKEIAPSACSEQEAIKRFQRWKGEKETIPVEGMIIDRVVYHDELDGVKEARIPAGTTRSVEKIPEHSLIDLFMDWIINRPKWLAQRTGIEQLVYLDKVERISPLTLAQVAKTYQGKQISADEMERSLAFWKEFCRKVKVSSVEDITEEDIERWGRHLHSGKFAPKTIIHRINKVQSILKYAKPRHKKNSIYIDRVKLDISALIKRPKKPPPNPTPLSPKHLQALLSAADIKWTAIILMALNCALHPKEAADIRLSEISLSDRTFKTNRTKTGVDRSAKLWTATIRAIKAYLKERAYESKYLFVNEEGKRLNRHSINDNWKRICRKAKIRGFSFDCLRDSCRTWMAGDAEAAAMVMGQEYGESVKYTSRIPEHTVKVLNQVKKKYRIK